MRASIATAIKRIWTPQRSGPSHPVPARATTYCPRRRHNGRVSGARALIVGTGYAGQRHAEALRELAVDFAGPISARELARDPGILRAHAVQVVHVCAANDLHVPLVAAALDAGKDVVCEKPLAIDAAGAKALVEAARTAGRLGVVAYTYRFYPLVVDLVGRARDGAIGDAHFVRGRFLQDWLLDPNAADWRLDAARGGASRVIADLGVHWLDLAERATGRHASAVVAQVGRLHGRATEDHAALLVRFDGGVQGVCVLSQASAGHRNSFGLAIDGADGSLEWRWERPDEIVIGSLGSSLVVSRERVTTAAARALATLPASANEGRRNLLAAVYRVMAGGIAGDVELPTFEDGLRHARFVEAALRSASEGGWVDLA